MITITEKVLLSDCQDVIVLDDGKENKSKKYEIAIPNTPYLIVEVGCIVGSAAATFNFPNTTSSVKRIYEFKHYRSGGGKYWTSKAGISHYFLIPTNQIYILPVQGLSYIHAEINGVKVMFNVSGGGGGEGWTDYLMSYTQISVNHKLKDIKKIAEVAVKRDDLNFEVKEMETNDMERWQNMSDKASNKLIAQRSKLYKMIEKNEKVHIVLNKGFKVSEGLAIKMRRGVKKVKGEDGHTVWDYSKGALKSILCDFGMAEYTVKARQIDWVETCKKNFEKNEVIA